jgi:LysR family transcriptional regulator, nod-box dependent transcriptional activator
MNLNGLDLNLLVTLDAIFAEKSVSRAGERLNLSQSATSGALARLRETFNDPLLVQVGRKMALTPLAEELVDPVREFLLQAEAILHMRPAFNAATSTRKFRLMMSDYVETVLMTEAVPRIQAVAPGITFEFISNGGGGLEVLERGEVDLAIAPRRHLSPNHPLEPLFDDEFTCLVWSGNTLVGDHISSEQYFELGHVVVRLGNWQQPPTLEEWYSENVDRKRRIEVVATAFNLVPQLLVGTTRVGTLHRRLSEFYARYLPLKLLPPPIEISRFQEWAQWHSSREGDPGIVWLRSVFRSVMQNLGSGPGGPTAKSLKSSAR